MIAKAAMNEYVPHCEEENSHLTEIEIQSYGRVTSPRSDPDKELLSLPGTNVHPLPEQRCLNVCNNISLGGTLSVETEDDGQHIIERSETEVQRGIRGMIRTTPYTTLIRKIQEGQSWTIIKGCPGEGKTTLAYFVMNYLREKGFSLYIVKSKEEYFSIREFKPKSVVMLNDIFGVFAFDLACLDYWLIVLGDLEQMINNPDDDTQLHVVISTRNYVLQSALPHLDRFSIVFDDKSIVVDLTTETPLTKEDKKDILRCHLQLKKIQLDQQQTTVEKICDLPTVHGFPHCCLMFANIKEAHQDPIGFFSRPLNFLNNTTRKLMQDEQVRKLFYAILKNDGFLRKTDVVMDEIGVTMNRREILDTSYGLVGSYLTNVSNSLSVSHPSILWSIAYVLGCQDPELLIKMCPVCFINELVILSVGQPLAAIRHVSSTAKIKIDKDCVEILLDRFVEEIESNNLMNVLSHQAFTIEVFTEQFLYRTMQKPNLKFFLDLKDKTSSKSFLRLASSNKSDILLRLITKSHRLTGDKQKDAFLGCCELGSAKAFQFLLEKYPDLDMSMVDENQRTPLILAARNGIKEIVELLVPRTDIHAKDFMDMNALHCSLENGQTEVACFLVENGIRVNDPDRIHRSALHYAAWGGHQNVVCFLLEKGADVNFTDKDEATALHDACYRGYEQVTETLIKAGSDVNKQNSWNETPLSTAAAHGHRGVVRCLLRSGCCVNLKNGMGQTAEDIARKYGHGEIVDFIERHKWLSTVVKHSPSTSSFPRLESTGGR